MVTIFLAAADAALATHDFTARPSISTVQAPHWPSPQPYFVPIWRPANFRFSIPPLARPPVHEQIRQLLQRRLPPLRDLNGMNLELRSQLAERLQIGRASCRERV